LTIKDPAAERRPAYQADLAGGTGRFFEPRRASCPWCGSTGLATRLRTRDLLQRKPGSFVLDRCDGCGHVFQNPRLNPAGLDFYYRDFYDGLGEKRMNTTFGGRGRAYRGRAAFAKSYAAPRTWLDVGTGHGHFCEHARGVWPDTTFDGLDLSDGVRLAEEHGRIARGHRGLFVDLAHDMVDRYDLVSMFHYLEHSTEPAAELVAARTALRAGGHLLIEVPDPQSWVARVLGRWWLPWLQPQHLHLMPLANLRGRLAELGFTVVAEQRAAAHDPVDLVAATWMLLDNVAPPEDAPWLHRRPGRLRRAVRTAIFVAGVPLLVAAALADRLLAPVARRTGGANAYRLLARKDGAPDEGALR
jgi:SAM-dependent methyltransferase